MTLLTQDRLDQYAALVAQVRQTLDARQKERTLTLLEGQRENAKRLYRRMRAALGLHGKKETQAEDDSDLPRPLAWLIRQLKRQLSDLFDELTAEHLTPAEWRIQVRRLLAEHHLAAMMAGLGSENIPSKAWNGLVDTINYQIEFLNNFKIEIQNDAEFKPGWEARAASYAESIKVPYWRGRTKILPLPAMPGEGSQCLQGCQCKWDVKPIAGMEDSYTAKWVLERNRAVHHCQTCLERSEQWANLRIIDGVLQ